MKTILIFILATLMSVTMQGQKYFYNKVNRMLLKNDNTIIAQLSTETGVIFTENVYNEHGETIALNICVVPDGGDTTRHLVRNTVGISVDANIYHEKGGYDRFIFKADQLTWQHREKVLDTVRTRQNWVYKFIIKEPIKRT